MSATAPAVGPTPMVDFRLLGPVEVTVGGVPVPAGQPRQRCVLAVLLAEAGRPVAADTLIERVWGEDAPDGARHTLHTYLGRIRAMLTEIGLPDTLLRRAGSYVLAVEPSTVDVHRFRDLVDKAREAAPAERVPLLDLALGLWHGEALAGLLGEWPARVRHSWLQERLRAEVLRAEAHLAAGEPEVVLAGLAALVDEYPLDEPLTTVLIRCLHAAGYTTEAMDRYTAIRKRMVQDLGIEPGEALRTVYEAVRGPGSHAQPSPPASARAVPAQLPSGVPGFTGRDDELDQLDAAQAEGERHGHVGIVAVCGMAGVGKTTLAVAWAHRVADQFPDGQLYVNLQGFGPSADAMAPAEAMRGLLEALEVAPRRIPSGLAEMAALYRSVLSGRRVLLVLDNARDADQVRPLLPGSAGCVVVVTSRDRLAGLVAAEGAWVVALDTLAPQSARRLLVRRIGEDRVAAEPEAVDRIVAMCGGLPLALAVVAARAAIRRGFPLATIAADLTHVRTGLDAFADDDPAIDIRAVLSWSYQALDPDAARLFRLLGSVPGPDLAGPAAARLAGLADVQPLLRRLIGLSLLDEPKPGRYALHDLLRDYAREMSATVDNADDRAAATQRWLAYYVHTSRAASMTVDPQQRLVDTDPPDPDLVVPEFPNAAAALAWFGAEHQVLLAALAATADNGDDRAASAYRMANAMMAYLDRRAHWHDWAKTQLLALRVAHRLGDLNWQARAHRAIGLARIRLGDVAEALPHLDNAFVLFGQSGSPSGQARVRLHQAHAASQRRQYAEALRYAEQARELYHEIGDAIGEGTSYNEIGWYEAQLGELRRSVASCRLALEIQRTQGDREGESNTWDSLGYAYHHLGDHTQARSCYRRSLELLVAMGDRYYQAVVLDHIGDTEAASGDRRAADAAWTEALSILDELHHTDAEAIRAKLTAPAR